ncbi:MAG: PD-(D/E)XK nuclease family protein, partial [Lachnospiraceae bacterium]|nr:PD-(D/E)XK nuclease family protein [Lachnospiraceae bacterium]
MGLRFILGPSGSGKSYCLYEDLIKASMENRTQGFFLMVPDQFTMQTQKDIVSMHPLRGILNLDVLSFGRLTYRAFRSAGVNRPILDDTGKNLILRRLAGAHQKSLPALAGKLSRTGFIHEVKSVLSEFMQYGISPEDVSELIEASAEKGLLKAKLTDLQTLYRLFKTYLGEHYLTSEEALDVLCQIIPKLDFLQGSVFAFDGFTGFTPIQLRVIEALLKVCEEVSMVLTIDEASLKDEKLREEELFYLSKKTKKSLEQLAEKNKIPRTADLFLERNYRFQNSPYLSKLENQLFRNNRSVSTENQTPIEPAFPSEIRLSEHTTPEEELRHACQEIRNLLREGYEYRDIAIILGDIEPYRDWVEVLAKAYEIPCFLDETRNLRMNPLVEMAEGAVEILASNYHPDAVFRFLRCGLSGFSREEIDLLERYCEAYKIKGKSAWETPFGWKKRLGLEDDSLQKLNEVRVAFLEALSPLRLLPAQNTAREWAPTLHKLLSGLHAEDTLAALAKRFQEDNLLDLANEYSQVYHFIIDLLDQLYELLAEETLNAREFLDILDAGISEIRIGRIPQSVDKVLIGDMERTRLSAHNKVLFFLGINDGNIPKAAAKGGLLSELDREHLLNAGFALSPSGRELQYTQRLYLYLNMTKPSDRLFLSWYRVNAEGKAVRPSYLTGEVAKLFPSLQVETGKESLPYSLIETLPSGYSFLAESLREEENLPLLHFYQNQAPKTYQRLLEAACLSYEAVPLSENIAALLFGKRLQTSVSRLEGYASCAYAHFLRFGLSLDSRNEAELSAIDSGTLLHACLQSFPEKAKERGYTLRDCPDEILTAAAQEAVAEACREYGEEILKASSRNAYLIPQLLRILIRSLKAFRYQLSKGDYAPARYELEVAEAYPNLDYHGKIDRIDIARKDGKSFLKIIDYKTGSKKFDLAAVYEGIELQLPAYLGAVLSQLKRREPEMSLTPGGMFYQPVDDPIVDAGEIESEDASGNVSILETERRKRFIPSGIAAADPEILRL